VEFGTIYGASNELILSDGQDPGLLIAFEGSDGAGKTTQRQLFKTWLKGLNQDVVVTKWNSSPGLKPLIKARKAARVLGPVEYAVLHAADFRDRYDSVIVPSLQEAKVVLADRYIFTGIARDTARGLDRGWSMQLYGPVRRPDIIFYFSASPETCAARIAADREIKFYESGQDVTGLVDPLASYLAFAPRVMKEYERLGREFDFVMVDAEKSIYEQHRFIRETFEERLHCSREKPLLHAFYSQVDV
jgi:dTMP kinase